MSLFPSLVFIPAFDQPSFPFHFVGHPIDTARYPLKGYLSAVKGAMLDLVECSTVRRTERKKVLNGVY
jgi:hypothetical protein